MKYVDENEEIEMEDDTEVKPQVVEINENIPLKRKLSGVFFDKSLLLKPQYKSGMQFVIKGLKEGKYGYTIDIVKTDSGESFVTDLNTTNYNWLLDNLGGTVSDWKNIPLLMFGKEFSGRKNKDGEEIKGIAVNYEREE